MWKVELDLLDYCDRKKSKNISFFPTSSVILVASWPFFQLNITEKGIYCTICQLGSQGLFIKRNFIYIASRKPFSFLRILHCPYFKEGI